MQNKNAFVLIEKEDMEVLKKTQQLILEKLEKITPSSRFISDIQCPYITAGEFMKAVRIRRWKFNCLVGSGKIMTIKKKRKIYVPKGEVERYFLEVNE
jgi:hypothetical protein